MNAFLALPLVFEHLLLFSVVLARTGALVVTAPLVGTPEVPAQVRALVAVALAALVFPAQTAGPPLDVATPLDWTLLIVAEAAVGAVLGLGVTILLAGVQLAGQVIGQLGGMALAETFNPGFDGNVPLISQLLHLVALAIYVVSGGHRLLIGGLLGTFEALPPGQALLEPSWLELIVTVVEESMLLGIRAAAPASLALLLATVVLGLIGRTIPQLNVLALGFGLNALVTFAVLALSIAGLGYLVQDTLEPALDVWLEALTVSAP